MSRGRLVFPMTAELARIDTATTNTSVDPDFRTVKANYPGGLGVREKGRKESTPIKLPCQVEIGAWEQRRQEALGNTPDSNLTLVFHFSDLEAADLIDASGDPKIRVGDRLVAIWDRDNVNRLQKVDARRGGLYAVRVQPDGYGLAGTRNLLIVVFEERPQGIVS